MGYKMNGSLNNLVGGPKKNKRKKNRVIAKKDSKINIGSQSFLDGADKNVIKAKRNSQININNITDTVFLKPDTVQVTSKPDTIYITKPKPKPKIKSKTSTKPSATTSSEKSFTPPRLPVRPIYETKQDKVLTKWGKLPKIK